MKKNHVLVAVGLGLAQLILHANAVEAQSTKQTQDTVKNLNEVVVTATRSPKKLSDIGRNVTVITAAQIHQSQGKTVPELLNTIPGITFSGAENNRGLSSDVYIRGASAGNTLVLVDGFPVNDASGIAGNYDLNSFPIDQIDRIEILKGSNSTLYGSDAVAGVINIITKKALNQKLTPTIQGGVGSYKTYTSAIGLNGTINKTGVSINVSNVDYGGFAAPTDITGNAGFKNDGFRQRSVSLNLTQSVSAKLTLNGNVQTSYDTGDLPYGAFQNDNDYNYDKTYLFGGIGAKLALPKGALRFNVSQNNVWNNYQNLPSDNFGASSTIRNLGRITNAEAILNQTFNKYLDITSGVDFKYANTDQYSLYSSTSFPNTTPTILNNVSTNIASVYTSVFFKSNIFHMELGGRYNHHNKYGDNFTYTVNPSVVLNDRFKVYASVASAYVAPSLYQLYSVYGTPNLKPQTTQSYETGFEMSLVKNILSFTSDFFKRKTTDVIYFANLSVAPYGQYLNGSKQDDQGFESELSLNYKGLVLSGYTAYVVGHLTSISGVETGNLLRRPKNTYGANAAYTFAKVLTIGVNYKYTGDRFDTEFLNVAPYSRIDELPSYNIVDVHLQYSPVKSFSVYLDFKNLFDEQYTDWIGYNTRGFNVMSGFKYTFN